MDTKMKDGIDFEAAVEKARDYPTLGPAYYLAREFAEKLFQGTDAEPFKKAIKKFSDSFYAELLEAFENYIISNAESSVQSHIYHTVDRVVNALLAGNKWAVERYITGKYHDHMKVREALAALLPEEIKSGRISDLEKEVKDLREQISWLRR